MSYYILDVLLYTQIGREQQLAVVLEEFAKYPRAILLGNLNSAFTAPLLEQTLADDSIHDAISDAGLDIDQGLLSD